MSRPAILVLILTASASTAEPKTDADGVPLPEGAIARLGSARFRFDGTPYCPPAFSPDGKLVAVGSSTRVAVIDMRSGRRIHRFSLAEGHHPRSVRFLGDGKRLAVGSGDWQRAAELTIWDVLTEKVVSTAKFNGKSQIFVVDVTTDGARALVEDRFAKIFLWDVAAGRAIWMVEHKEATSTLPFTMDGKNFVVSGYRKAELYDAATGKVVGEYPNPGPGFGLSFSPGLAPDGRIAMGHDKGTSVAVLGAVGENRLRLLSAGRRVDRPSFSPDGHFLVGCAYDDIHTQVWDLTAADDKGPIAWLPASTRAAFSPDGKTLALAGNGYLTLWAVGTWKPLPASANPPSQVFREQFAADGKTVIGYTRQGWVRWPAAGGPMERISDDSTVSPEGSADLSADGRTGLDMLVEPGPGPYGRKATLRVTDLTTGMDRRIPFEYSGWSSARISPDGKFAMSYAGDQILIWDLGTGEILHRRKSADREVIFGMAALPDGRGLARLVVGSFGEGMLMPGRGPAYTSVTVYDHLAGREWKMDPMPWLVYSDGARFSREASRLVLHGQFDKSGNDSVSVWNTATGRRLMKWDAGSSLNASIVLAADNRSLLTGSMKGDLALVEVATGGERVNFRHGGSVGSAAFSPDGTKVVSSSPNGPVYVWDLLGETGRWEAAKADAVWNDLASSDAKVAFGAIRKLRANPVEAVAFVKERVKLPAVPTVEAVAKMLKGLDTAAFAERERAQRDLTAAADLIRPKLETARKTASEEAGLRLDQILKAVDGWTPDKLRHVRACEVLEGIGTPEAIGLLKSWAVGPEGARLTVESKESVARKSP
jgi:WD40 repeat protein